MLIDVIQVVKYNGHSVKRNGSIDIKFISAYDQITNSIEVLQMLNNDVKIICKLPGEKPFSIGVFRVKDVKFDGDGESHISFNSINIHVEMDKIGKIVTDDLFVIKMSAKVEEE